MSTCNQLDLETLGFRPIMAKILPRHMQLVSYGILCHCGNYDDDNIL